MNLPWFAAKPVRYIKLSFVNQVLGYYSDARRGEIVLLLIADYIRRCMCFIYIMSEKEFVNVDELFSM